MKKKASLVQHVAHGVAGLANLATVLAAGTGLVAARDAVVAWRANNIPAAERCDARCEQAIKVWQRQFEANLKQAREGMLVKRISGEDQENLTELVERYVPQGQVQKAAPVAEASPPASDVVKVDKAVDIRKAQGEQVSRAVWKDVLERVASLQKRGKFTAQHRKMLQVMNKRVALLADPDGILQRMVPPEMKDTLAGLEVRDFLEVWGQGVTVFMEAKGEQGLGMAAVNRAMDNRGGGLGTVMEFAQFSCWGEAKAPLPVWNRLPPEEREAFRVSMGLAALSRLGADKAMALGLGTVQQVKQKAEVAKVLSAETRHYLNPDKLTRLPAWAREMEARYEAVVLGNHRFYDETQVRIALPEPNPARAGNQQVLNLQKTDGRG